MTRLKSDTLTHRDPHSENTPHHTVTVHMFFFFLFFFFYPFPTSTFPNTPPHPTENPPLTPFAALAITDSLHLVWNWRRCPFSVNLRAVPLPMPTTGATSNSPLETISSQVRHPTAAHHHRHPNEIQRPSTSSSTTSNSNSRKPTDDRSSRTCDRPRRRVPTPPPRPVCTSSSLTDPQVVGSTKAHRSRR